MTTANPRHSLSSSDPSPFLSLLLFHALLHALAWAALCMCSPSTLLSPPLPSPPPPPLSFPLQDINPETMENMIGADLPVKFLEVDEEKERLVFSNKRVAGVSTADLQGYKVRQRPPPVREPDMDPHLPR